MSETKSETFLHTCSCGKKYNDTDPDPYFCPSCVADRKKIAEQVDKQMANKPTKRKVMSNFQIAVEKGKTMTSASGGYATFVRASDLGINFN